MRPASHGRGAVRRALSVALGLAAIGAAGAGPAAASADRDTFVFRPTADTYVNASAPSTSAGASSSLYTDASPVQQTLLRWDVAGISGRTVRNVRLRMYHTDSSAPGARVSSISPTSWDESVTWLTRPAIDGPEAASFGALTSNRWYEVSLGPIVAGDGSVSLAIDSPHRDGSRWSSRESVRPPKLLVDVDDDALALDGLSEIASGYEGSSNPTQHAANHHLAMTRGGRLLTVHGVHGSGLQLAWRDAGGGWQADSAGDVDDGLLLQGTGTGDWPASIATAVDPEGNEHAWVVWGAASFSRVRPVQMRRLSDLDAPGGPTVGPVVTVEASELGGAQPDIGFERGPDGTMRGTLVWTRRTGDSAYDVVAARLTDLSGATPAVHDHQVLVTSSSTRWGTVVPDASGARVVTRDSSGKVRVHRRDANDPLAPWTAGSAGVAIASSARVSAVALATGEVLATAETNTTSATVAVQRFSATGTAAPVELSLTGYRHPTLTSDGDRAWLVMIHAATGSVVSRELDPDGWSAFDRVEIGPEGGGSHDWPNALRSADGRLTVVTRGPSASSSRGAVLAFQRPA